MLGLLLGGQFSAKQVSNMPEISYPLAGEVVEGIVEIRGSIPEAGFESARLAYAYDGVEEVNWFLIQKIDMPVQDAVLGAWDTTTITDGTYQIRLVIRDESGAKTELVVDGIQVANYSPSDGTTENQEETIIVVPSVMASPEPVDPTPTMLPLNPATITESELHSTVQRGLMIGLGLVVLIGLWAHFIVDKTK